MRCLNRACNMNQRCFVSVLPCFPMSISQEISGSLVLCISVRDLTITTARKLNLLANSTLSTRQTHSGIISTTTTTKRDDVVISERLRNAPPNARSESQTFLPHVHGPGKRLSTPAAATTRWLVCLVHLRLPPANNIIPLTTTQRLFPLRPPLRSALVVYRPES